MHTRNISWKYKNKKFCQKIFFTVDILAQLLYYAIVDAVKAFQMLIQLRWQSATLVMQRSRVRLPLSALQDFRRILHVKCCCNGENCKINIARVISGLQEKFAQWLTMCVVSIFALQLLNSVVNIFHRRYWHGCMVMLFFCLYGIY